MARLVPPHLYWGKGCLGRGQTKLSLLPLHLWALAELLWHEIQAAISMATSHLGSTSFTQWDWTMNLGAFNTKKTTQHAGKMCHFTHLPITVAKIGLICQSCCRHKRWLENMLNSWWEANGGSLWQHVSHWGGRARQSQRYGWGCCDSCELSQCLLCQPTASRKRRNTFYRTGPLN